MREKRGALLGVWLAVVLACLLLLATSAAAIDYYADIVIDVASDGTAEISGTTNHPALIEGKTSNLTSKKGEYWTLQLSPSETFSDYIFKVILPENADINYVKAPSQVRISEEGKRLVIIGTGSDQKLSILMQYSFGAPEKNLLNELLLWFGPALGIIVLGLALLMLGNRKASQSNQQPDAKPSYNPDTLTDRQSQILEIIKSGKGIVTQAMVEKAINIPKSSISRNIDSLARKGIISKDRRGMSNILTLKK
jgi:uncharacterized membrane protein